MRSRSEKKWWWIPMRDEAGYREIIQGALQPTLEGLGGIPPRLMEAMLYSLTAGGKRLRPVLLLASCEMAGGSIEKAIPYACALEMIHTYSLIHDDLPGMDNDDLRRGKPTNHKVFGEGMAILAGDGLLNSALEIALKTAVESGDFGGVRAAEILARHAGVSGMIGGQSVDILMEGSKPTEETVAYIHAHKTADLIQAPMEMGLTLAGCKPEIVSAGACYGYHLGMAFQIVDDLLDALGDPEILGKNVGMDKDKMTWVALKGISGARTDAEEHTRKAVEKLDNLPWETGFFRKIALDNLMRNH